MDRYATLAAKMGLNPITAEPESNAILRIGGNILRRRSALLRDGAAMIVDIGMNRTRIDMIRNDQIEFTREFRFGARAFSERIATDLVLTQTEAAQLLENSGARLNSKGWLQIPTNGGIAQVDVNEALEILARESRRLVRYFRSIFPERSYNGVVSSALITGGLAGLHGLDRYMETNLGIETSRIDPLSIIRIDITEEEFVLLSRTPYEFSVAVGLALAIRNFEPMHTSKKEENGRSARHARAA